MKRFENFILLPVVAAVLLVAIYGSATLGQTQKQNRILETKIDELSNKLSVLTDGLNQNTQIAGVSTEISPGPSPKLTKKQPATINPVSDQIPTPTPSPSPSSTPKKAVAAVSAQPNTPTPVPAPTPTPTPAKVATVEVQGQNIYQVELQDSDTAFSILLRSGTQYNFSVGYTDYGSLGVMVNCIGSVCAHDNYYWAFYYNNQYAQVGASSQPVKENDITSWKFETW
ncbi:MAG: hypothetical protein HW405_511 [Candidatus Berkelbacteria bacterium]|nr:hypothetical protein [Candidatus Berkelbacteria bacterium]